MREKSGETAPRERASQPASGNFALASVEQGCDLGVARRRVLRRPISTRVVQRISAPGCTRPLARERIQRYQYAGAKADAGAEPVGLGDDARADLELEIAEREGLADLEPEPVEQRVVDDRAEAPVALLQRLRHGQGGR